MKMKQIFLILSLMSLVFTSCEKDEENLNNALTATEEKEEEVAVESDELDVEKFIYKGLNDVYLYKEDVPELADNYFQSTSEKEQFLNSFSSPEALFDNLKSSDDRFSFMVSDYEALEDSFNGVSGSTGIKFGLGRINNTDNVFGFLQYILPGTSAEEKGLTRGTVFTEINGQNLTISNYESLMSGNSFTINIGKVVDGTIVLTGETVTLSDQSYTSNPVYIAKTLNVGGAKVGYLMYNSFIGDFDDELNAAFATFKADGISDLILDLRYNGGGAVESAVDLSSMITGQFEGEVFMKENWNKEYQAYFEAQDPESLINKFDSKIRTGTQINSLNLSRVYVITSESTASASELVINGLEPYIDVIQIGDKTTGKFQASVTLYDSDDFGRENANSSHKYAIQPLIFKSANASGKTDYVNGLAPDVNYVEDLGNMGVLGDESEPLLKAALNHLLGRSQEFTTSKSAERFQTIGESGMNQRDYQQMYVEKIPPVLLKNKE